LRILFKQERRLYVLENHISRVLDDDAFIEVKIKYHCYIDDDDDDDEQTTCVYNMIKHIKKLFDVKGYKTSKELFPSMIIEYSNVNTHVMFMIENYLATSHSSSWVLDIECGFHIYNNNQELKKYRRLLKGEVELRVSNGARVAALAVRTYNLTLPSRMLLELDNFYFVPVLEEIKPNGSK
jgi:hypothetical protein